MSTEKQPWLEKLLESYKVPKTDTGEKKQILTESQRKILRNGKS